MTHGEQFHAAGASFLTIVEKRLPKGVDRRLVDASRNWVVVVSPDGSSYMTCYRRTNALKYLVRKPKRDATRVLPREMAYAA